MDANARAFDLLGELPPRLRLELAVRRLSGEEGGPLGNFQVASEEAPLAARLDGRLLESLAARELSGVLGAVFTSPPEARILAVLGLTRIATRRGIPEAEALGALLGAASPSVALARALAGVRVLDPCCGGGALLAAALLAARACGAEPSLLGLDVAPIAAEATRARLGLLRARPCAVACADALSGPWPAADLVLANPPFLRHEAMDPASKARAVARTGLGRRADLSAHLALLALRHAPDVALVWPRGLEGARSAAPLRAEAAARGGYAFRLRSCAAGSFAASVDTTLLVWSEGATDRLAFEATVPLAALAPHELASLSGGEGGPNVSARPRRRAAPRGTMRLDGACAVRFGMKSGCNAFFHLRALGGDRHVSALLGEVMLPPGTCTPILASLKEASAPGLAAPTRLLFRPPDAGHPGSGSSAEHPGDDPLVRSFLARGEEAGVAMRPTCRGRRPWWLVSPGRAPAPVLYPAKVGARAFGFLNEAAFWEDKKWHALFPRGWLPPWLLAATLSATPVRLAVEENARQLTGAQAIADIDCNVLAAAPFPEERALLARGERLAACWAALVRDPVTTDLSSMLARPAQEELDHLVGEALGEGPRVVEEGRRELLRHVAARLGRALQVRAAVAAVGRR